MDMIPNIPLESLRDEPIYKKRICVIGAGASGLAALKVISQSDFYKTGQWSVVAFENRTNVGGVWFPAAPTDNPPLTPLYDSLTTNLPHPVMAYTSYSFPPSTSLFPNAAIVQEYIESYAAHFDLLPLIRLNTAVIAARWETSIWSITLSTGESMSFDHIVVANGHYRLPRIPDTPGLSEWILSGKASHSAWYRHPDNFGDVVLVVGGGPSGKDISADMSSVSKAVIHSVTGTSPEDVGNLKRRPRVVEYRSNGEVVFEDGSMEHGIDHCILATGYQMDFPFFDESVIRTEIPPPSPPLPRDLYNSTYHIFPLARHVFPLQNNYPTSSLAFMGLLFRVAPMPLVEAQAHAIVRVFSDPSCLDGTQEAVDIITRSETLQAQGAHSALQLAKAWFRFEEHEQFDYRDEMYKFAARPGSNGEIILVPDWEKEMYHEKDKLRVAWRKLEQSGEAEKWVAGVGKGGTQEWVEMMRELLKWADQNDRDQVAASSSSRL
ncbi:hypothetical protein BJ138DRAFT_374266 [Hygrophoropsis aurantiaca]|uniref:Uncharacterized protein n=1 Tax=Hygrophoropsis aurantiaca TaxID=72124 RepID=A0ACB8A4C6_9AGAM|nr:hypothetical protein BJ138DRAFT_374266 [Hygrophoropsis aurantiaca]